MAQPSAVIVGGGIGGLTAAIALHQRGWRITVCERSPGYTGVGSGIALGLNALRALDVLELGDALRARAAADGFAGIRRPRGNWLTHHDVAAARTSLGDPPLIGLHRAELVRLLLSHVPSESLLTGVSVTEIEQGDRDTPATVRTDAGEHTADLVVAADGIHSTVRTQLFPECASTRYAGYTSWRIVGANPTHLAYAFETWGRGIRFGIIPISRELVYCYATANLPAGDRADDEKAELVNRFGQWHDPIPALVRGVDPDALRRLDIYELAVPLPAFHRGRVALLGDAAHAMTPDLGQGGCMAIEDAVVLAHLVSGGAATGADASATDTSAVPDALAEYTAARLPRTQAITHAARAFGQAAQLESRTGVVVRDLKLRLGGLLPRSLAASRGPDPILGWEPPPPPAREPSATG